MNQDEIYAQIAREIETGQIDKSLWTRLYAECDGDETKTKVQYIKQRADRLSESIPQDTPHSTPATASDTSPPSQTLSEAPLLADKELYKVCIGDKRAAYYLEKFEVFDRKGSGLHASWNWAALLVSVAWPLYRKMYGWFFIFFVIFMLSSMADKSSDSQWIGTLIIILPGMLFAVYANSLYHGKIKKRIFAARLIARNENQLLEMLKSGSGVQGWVVWVAGIIPVLGIVAAIVIPAMQKRSENTHQVEQYAKERNADKQTHPAPSAILEPVNQGDVWLVEEGSGHEFDKDKRNSVYSFTSPNGDKYTVVSFLKKGTHEQAWEHLREYLAIDARNGIFWAKYKGTFDVKKALSSGASYKDMVDYLISNGRPELTEPRAQGYSDKSIMSHFE